MAKIHRTGHMSSKILAQVVSIIDVTVQRATWKGEEIGHIAQLREIFAEATNAARTAELELEEKISKDKEKSEEVFE
jgi:ABC-type enterochelin transport system substrate-binding protein